MGSDLFFKPLGWMRTTLGLKGQLLSVYAIVYGFSQDGASSFKGGLDYICNWLGCCRNTARKYLRILTDDGFIIREDSTIGGRLHPTYRHNPSRICPHPNDESVQIMEATPTRNVSTTPPKSGGKNKKGEHEYRTGKKSSVFSHNLSIAEQLNLI